MRYYVTDPTRGLPLYGLYDVVADCFLLVLPNLTVAQHLKYILSSRYHLHVCHLDTASNYSVGMIDNNNCDVWSLSNRDSVAFADPVSTVVVPVTELVPTRETNPEYKIAKEKEWCQFCAHCVYILDNERDDDGDYKQVYWHYSKQDEYLNSFLRIDQVGYAWQPVTDEIKSAILKLLYLGRDLEQTQMKIREMVSFA